MGRGGGQQEPGGSVGPCNLHGAWRVYTSPKSYVGRGGCTRPQILQGTWQCAWSGMLGRTCGVRV